MTEKITLIAINSQYVHTNLAVHYIKSSLIGYDVVIIEDNINENIQAVFTKIADTGANVYAFSTYIFNIEYIKKLAIMLKEKHPESRVIFGGIEAENDRENLLPFCDNIIVGEGEKSILAFLKSDRSEHIFLLDKGNDSKIIVCQSPYTEEYFALTNGKLAYFEATRGCPFKCSYCMSCGTGVKYFDIEFVKSELAKFFYRNIRGLKFVDRTFNLPNKYSKEILQFIVDNEDKYPFPIHFEVAPELFDDEYFDIIAKSKSGKLQFELGMQTLNNQSLEAVNRKNDAEKIVENITKLTKSRACSIHCDLIAGLPHEDMVSFAKSFDLLYSLRPNEIQVGLLKVLKGSKLKEDIAGDSAWEYSETPPYSVVKTPVMSADDIRKVRLVEIAVNKLYNSGRFKRTLDYLIEQSPFAFFCDLAEYSGDLNGKHVAELYECVLLYCKERLLKDDEFIEHIKEIMRTDFYLTNSGKITPKCLYKPYSPQFARYRKQENLRESKLFYYETRLSFENRNGAYTIIVKNANMIISVDYSEYKNINKEFGWSVAKILDY